MKNRLNLKKTISDEARDLIRGLLRKEVSKRFTIDQILNHEWLKDVPDTKDCK